MLKKYYIYPMNTETPEEVFYRIALSLADGIGSRTAKSLLQHFGSAKAVFEASPKDLCVVEHMGLKKAKGLRDGMDTGRVEEELKFIERSHIKVLFFDGKEYPRRLRECTDGPALLYYRGDADLNAERVVAIVGTRRHSSYGAKITEELVEGLKANNITIISGLAAGIDSIAHRRSVECDIPTVGVLAHGLDRIYPEQHREMARQMLVKGGLLTEYPSCTNPDRYNFPMRNRIVAGMSDVVVVVETGTRGGAMITAKLAAAYNRDIAAFPGRTIDSISGGCNYLIRTHMAQLITNHTDLMELMNWDEVEQDKAWLQPVLFGHLSDEETSIVNVLQGSGGMHIDELCIRTRFRASQLNSILLHLELNGMVRTLPGKLYRLN